MDGRVLAKRAVRVPCERSARHFQLLALAETAPYARARLHVRTARYCDSQQRVQNDWHCAGPLPEEGVPAQILQISGAPMLSTTCAGQLSSALMG